MSQPQICKRNVLIVGLDETGKSTIASKIRDHSACVDLNHQPTQTIAQEFEFAKEICGKNYLITVIDAMGFGTSTAMSKERVTELITYLRGREIYAINLIFFVIKSGRLQGDEKSILESAIQKFNRSHLSNISALLITHCEQYNEALQERIIALFKDGDHTRPISNLMSKGILTTGFTSQDYCNEALLENIERDIRSSLEKIEDLIAESSTEEEITNLFNMRHSQVCCQLI